MTPSELKRGPDGCTRLDRIREADLLVGTARHMADIYVGDIDRGFAPFANVDCDVCATAQACGQNQYEGTLLRAAKLYEWAGLGLLATRVRAIVDTAVVLGWQRFDEANATTEL